MKNSPKKYPASLFWTGVAVSILRSILWLIASTILLAVGQTIPWCAAAGLALFFAVIAVAIIKQLVYRHTVLHSDTPEFDDWQAAMLSPDWEENVKTMVERAMNDDIELPDDIDDLDDDLDDGNTDADEDEEGNTP